MNLLEINGFILPDFNETNPSNFAGFITRDSDVCVKYKDKNNNFFTKTMSNTDANKIIINIFKVKCKSEKERNKIDQLHYRIISQNNNLIKIGKELIADYNYEYYNERLKCSGVKKIESNDEYYISKYFNYFDKPKMCLIRLEQMFIQYDLPSMHIYELLKPKTKNNNYNALYWVKAITNSNYERLIQLKEYFDEYLFYVLSRPRNIFKINKLFLPFSTDGVKIEEFASYLNRNSIVNLKVLENDNAKLLNNKDSNVNFKMWIEQHFGEDSFESNKIEEYKCKIENLSVTAEPNERILNTIKLGETLNSDYRNYTNNEIHNHLIYLEQLIIRHSLPTSIIFEYTKPNACPVNIELLSWIKTLTNQKKKKIKMLKDYLDSYLEYTIDRKRDNSQIDDIWATKIKKKL